VDEHPLLDRRCERDVHSPPSTIILVTPE
jgi:hypothetical protein